MLILCKLFGHRRCTRHAYHAGATWVSVCRRCGVKLKRVAPGKWIARRRPINAAGRDEAPRRRTI